MIVKYLKINGFQGFEKIKKNIDNQIKNIILLRKSKLTDNTK
jgi:hypothetical protein